MTSKELPATLLRLPGSKPKLATPTDPLTGLEGEMRAVIALTFKLSAAIYREKVSPLELLAALIRTPCAGRDSLCLALMRPEDKNPKRVLDILERKCGMMSTVVRRVGATTKAAATPFASTSRQILQDAAHEAREMGDAVTGTQHIALALFRIRHSYYLSDAIKLGVTYFQMRLRWKESQRVKDATHGGGQRRNPQRLVLKRRNLNKSA